MSTSSSSSSSSSSTTSSSSSSSLSTTTTTTRGNMERSISANALTDEEILNEGQIELLKIKLLEELHKHDLNKNSVKTLKINLHYCNEKIVDNRKHRIYAL